ncbi:MAG: dolichol-phosphate mannosyltransferase [Candidatus Berkelbacteria bacterium Gr01-1014_85]|uniref:Dolichol-phosphate mannosyltransferase n=1 Tax=Candidatus Berkelbacteria bacterium Gr01-1014_85 TaxID=2017150 RepID=A0A554JA97_9BACT|nr:MAG: dolichol-phosphate mannosyltransferase [Candidatus Berkelbacteria bacterium Gr01-1014_85]
MFKVDLISVIVPAYNEAKNIRLTTTDLLTELDKISYPYELIVVCDGCTDATEAEAKAIKHQSLRVISYAKNQGKGYALKYGVSRAKGDVITFIDAGGDFHPSHIERFVKVLEAFDADIVIGSKRHPMSRVNYPLGRRINSALYHGLLRLLFNIQVRDTQTGLKLAKTSVLKEVMPRMVVKQYAYDVEMLVVATMLGYRRIIEAPVEMNFNFANSSLKSKTIIKALEDTFAIFYRKNILGYYLKPRYAKQWQAEAAKFKPVNQESKQ